MKYLMMLLIICGFYSCIEKDTLYNYPGAVIMEIEPKSKILNMPCVALRIPYRSHRTITKNFRVIWIHVYESELVGLSVGDTIK